MDDARYQIEQQVGRGHSGIVYLARHRTLGRPVALKLIRFRAGSNEILDEARKLASLPDHDNVVKVHDAGPWEDDYVFIASELCMGGSLAALSERRAMDPSRTCDLISETCRGLEQMHRHGLLHLDIRAANILLSESGVPRLANFGLARWTHDPAVHDWYGPHAAPELVETGRAEPATDIYAIGMTLAHLLTGGTICRPFPLAADLVQASADGDWPRLDELRINVPPKLANSSLPRPSITLRRARRRSARFKRALDKATPAVSFTNRTTARS